MLFEVALIVVSKTNNVPINVACTASSSMTGQVGPIFVKDPLWMDGGMSQSSTHCDVIAGVKRAIAISFGDAQAMSKNKAYAYHPCPIQLIRN